MNHKTNSLTNRNCHYLLDQSGFTLLELLVVIGIIGILAAVGIPVFNGQANNAKAVASIANFNNVKNFMISEIAVCSMGGQLLLPDGGLGLNCASGPPHVASVNQHFLNYFRSPSAGLQNPYHPKVGAFFNPANGTPINSHGIPGTILIGWNGGPDVIHIWVYTHLPRPGDQQYYRIIY